MGRSYEEKKKREKLWYEKGKARDAGHVRRLMHHPLVKRIFANPYGEVEDERPFRPRIMLEALARCGFDDIHSEAATFSHCSFYVPIAKAVNTLTGPLLGVSPLKYFGWLVLYWAREGHPGLPPDDDARKP